MLRDLQMMDARLFVNVYAKKLCLGGHDGNSYVDPAISAATRDIARVLAVRQHPVIQHEVPGLL